jgi:hypothetical protein
MKLFNTFLLKAKQVGVAVLVVHHQGKGKDSGPRGSTAMVATLNLILQLKASEQERAAGDKDARFTVVFEKNRGNVESRPIPVKITQVPAANPFATPVDDQGDLTLMVDPDADSNVIRAVRLLKTFKYATVSALADAFPCAQGQMSKTLQSAELQGLMTKEDRAEYFRKAREALSGVPEDVPF